MKNLNSLRKRGFTLIEITLVLIIGLGLIVGGLVYFSQAQSGSEVTDKTRAIVSISSEVRSQYRMKANFDEVATDATAPLATSAFAVRSGLQESTFNDIALTGTGQTFTITMSNLAEGVCERLAIADLGPKGTPDASDCGTGSLEVVYER